ncbi:MAG TPA: hypothetical protein VF516_23940 [Kofleriaceae bacterium]
MTTEEHHPQPHLHWMGTGHEIRARIEHALRVRSAPPGTAGAKLEHVVKEAGARLWVQLKKRPSIGVVLVGGAGLVAASAVGVGEIAIGMIAGYAAYQVLREGVSPGEAAKKIMEQIAKLG